MIRKKNHSFLLFVFEGEAKGGAKMLNSYVHFIKLSVKIPMITAHKFGFKYTHKVALTLARFDHIKAIVFYNMQR